MSALLGVDFDECLESKVVFTSIVTQRGIQATIVTDQLPEGRGPDPQPGYVAGYVCVPVGERGFGFLLVATLSNRVFFHINQVAAGSRPLEVGDRVDVS